MTLAVTSRNQVWCGLLRRPCWKQSGIRLIERKISINAEHHGGIRLLLPALCWSQGRVCGAQTNVQDGWGHGYGSLIDVVVAKNSGIWENLLPELWSGSCPVQALWAGEVPPIRPHVWFHYLGKDGLIKTTVKWLKPNSHLKQYEKWHFKIMIKPVRHMLFTILCRKDSDFQWFLL